MKVKGESFTETLKTLRRGKRRKTEEDRSLQKKRKEERKQKARKKSLGRKTKRKERMKAKSERHKKIASKGASLGKLRDVLSASWDELNYLS
jgi:hypothetical protein